MNITAVCPGSFDPVTLGHLEIITRASKMFDKVIVVILPNYAKSSSFSAEERVSFLRRATAGIPNVEIDWYDGLLAEYARQKQAGAIVKGLRALSDFEYEFQMALANKRLNPGADTVFLTASAENMYLSSSMVRQIAVNGGDISDFVPSEILSDIKARLNKKENII